MSLRVIAVGKTGSGKTEWIYRRYLRRLPRVLYVDTVGEWRAKRIRGGRFADGSSVSAWTVGSDATLDAVADLLERNEGEWRVVSTLTPEQFIEVAQELVPQQLDDSILWERPPCALFVDEVSWMIPLGESRASPLFQIGRHLNLSVYCATQRISQVNKVTTSQAEVVGVLGVSEPRDQAYLRERFGRADLERAQEWTQGGKYRVAVWADGELVRLPPEPA